MLGGSGPISENRQNRQNRQGPKCLDPLEERWLNEPSAGPVLPHSLCGHSTAMGMSVHGHLRADVSLSAVKCASNTRVTGDTPGGDPCGYQPRALMPMR